jgi:hypothetical protein
MVSKTEAVTVERKLVKAKAFANFSILTFNNDIAVLELESPVQLGTTVRPACLPADGKLSPVNKRLDTNCAVVVLWFLRAYL